MPFLGELLLYAAMPTFHIHTFLALSFFLGVLLIALALCFSESLTVLLRLFPQPALGVMLFLAGVQLALGSCDFARDKGERFVTLGTAALAIWNVGAAFLFGIAMLYIARRGWLKL
jgi:MFS superfamily sulfate permease-like transporter